MTLEIITDTWHGHIRRDLQWTPCPGAEGHKPEEGTMVVGKMVTAAVTEHWVPCSVVFGSKRRGGRRKPILSKAQLNGKLSVMAPPQIMLSSATSHPCVLGTFLSFFRYEAWRSERWSISHKGTQRPVGSRNGSLAWLILVPLVFLGLGVQMGIRESAHWMCTHPSCPPPSLSLSPGYPTGCSSQMLI